MRESLKINKETVGVIVHDFRTPTKQIIFALNLIMQNMEPIHDVIEYVLSLGDDGFNTVVNNLKLIIKKFIEKTTSQANNDSLKLAQEIHHSYKGYFEK